MAFLTDQIPATGVNLTDLFHVVDPNDISQGNPAGSSYKATFQQVIGALTGGTSVMVVGAGICSVERCGNFNNAFGAYSTVSGGRCNTSSGSFSIIGGGRDNTSTDCYSVVGGGGGNKSICYNSTISGGLLNTAIGSGTTISGGYCNTSSGNYSTVSGGFCNTSSGIVSTIGGGINNTSSGNSATVSGGRFNTSNGSFSIVGGGNFNKSIGILSTVSGGYSNVSNQDYSTVGGGINNTSSGNSSTVNGGRYNTSIGLYSTILGGSGNTVTHNCSGAFGLGVISVSANTFHVNNLALQNVPEIDVQTVAQYLTRDSSTGVVKTKIIAGPAAYGLYSQTGNSVVVSATTVETTIIGGGVGTLTVPASGFTVGDSFLAKLGGFITSKPGDTLTFNVYGGSVLLSTTGPISMPNIDPVDMVVWLMEITFTIRNVGGAGVGSIVTLGYFDWSNPNGSQEGYRFNTVNNTTFDTTTSNILDIKAQWSSTSTDNSIYSDVFVLTKTY
jgi:hypothetical protein